MEIGLSRLNLCILEMYRTTVNTHRGACFHSRRCNPVTCYAFCEMLNCRFCYSASRHHLAPNVHKSVEEGACGDDNGFGMKFNSPYCADTYNAFCVISGYFRTSCLFVFCWFSVFFYEQFVCLVLPDIKVWCVVKHRTPLPYELSAVALCARTPHGRSL